MAADPQPARPLVGREDEMTRFDALLSRGRGGLVLYGAAGSGKTRVAEALVERAAEAGHPTRFLRGRASIAELPLGPFAPLLPPAAERVEGVSLLVLARDSIAALGGGQTLVLGVDDVHLLDASSAMLLHQLVVSGAVLLVATVRDGEWIPDGVTELWRSGFVERWRIDDLAPDAVIEMAESILGTTIAPQVADELVRLSGGNPLFVATLVHAIRESGMPADRAIDLGEAASASTLVDFVTVRLNELGPAARDALAVVALGEPIGLQPLERMTDERSLVQLERGGWLVIADSGRRTEVRLAHPLFGEVLRRSLSRLLARSVYRELTQGTVTHGARRRDDLLRVAAWSVDGGTPLPPAKLVAAASEAAAGGDFSLSARLAEAAWDVEPTFDAGILLLFIHRSRRFLDDRDTFLGKLRALTVTPEQTAAVATTRSFEAFWRNGDLSAALAIVDDGIGTLDDSSPRDELYAQRAAYLALCGSADDARSALESIRSTEPRVVASVTYAQRILATSFGDPRVVLRAAEEFLGTAAQVTNDMGMLSVRAIQASLCRAMVHDGQVRRAEEAIRDSLQEPILSYRNAGTHENILGWVLAWRGRPTEGYRWAQRAALLQHREGFRTLELWSHAVMALCAALAGELDRADAAITAHDALEPNPTVISRGVLWHARTMAAATRGDIDGACALAARGLDDVRGHGLLFDEAVLLHVHGQLGGEAHVVEPLTALGERIGGMAALLAAHAQAIVAEDPERLIALAEEMAVAGADGLAARFSAEAGSLYERRRDTRAAARTARRTRELISLVEAAEHFVDQPHLEPLSRREREVAELAAAGMPTREIAERLFLSGHTVDNHLSNAYDKLGVRSRAELAAALAEA